MHNVYFSAINHSTPVFRGADFDDHCNGPPFGMMRLCYVFWLWQKFFNPGRMCTSCFFKVFADV